MLCLLIICSFSEPDLFISVRDQLSQNQSFSQVISNLSQFLSNDKNILPKDKLEAYTLRSTAYLKIGKVDESLSDAEKASNSAIIKLAKGAKTWLNFIKSAKSKGSFKIDCYIKLFCICPFSDDFVLDLFQMIRKDSSLYKAILSKGKNILPPMTISAIQSIHSFYEGYEISFKTIQNFEKIYQKIYKYESNIDLMCEKDTDEYFNECKQILQDLLISKNSPQYNRLVSIIYPNQIKIENYYTSQTQNNNNPKELYSILGLPIKSSKILITQRYNFLNNIVKSKEYLNLNEEKTEVILEFIRKKKELIDCAYTILIGDSFYYDFLAENRYVKINSIKKFSENDETTYKLYLSNGGYYSYTFNTKTGISTLIDLKSDGMSMHFSNKDGVSSSYVSVSSNI